VQATLVCTRPSFRIGSAECKGDLPWSRNGAQVGSIGFEILDWLSVGFLLCDSGGRLLHANQTVDLLLRNPDGLRLDASGRLRSSKPTSPALSDVIRDLSGTTSTPLSESGHRIVTVYRPSGKWPLVLVLFNAVPIRDLPRGPSTAVPVVIWEQKQNCDSGRLRILWSLTPAESVFAQLLMSGMSLMDCCRQLKICRATGAFHLKNLFRKTGTGRQLELLSVLFRGVGPWLVEQPGPMASAERIFQPAKSERNFQSTYSS
jgi:DNA-binding CsgD family transcriptional regulator